MTTNPLHPFLFAAALSMPALAQKPPGDAQRLATACNQFAADLHGKLAASGSPTCSPASIAIALLMLLPGARGDTAKEIATVLHLPEDLRGERMHRAARDLLQGVGLMQNGSPNRDVPPSPLVITNDLWVQQGFAVVPAYRDLLRSSFAAAQRDVDFAADAEVARQTINAHIAKATNDRIRDLLQPGMILPGTRVVLTNALWFKAAWEHTFWNKNTKDAPFTLADDSVVQVPTMRQTQVFGYADSDDWQVLMLPFASSGIVCEIVLPREGKPLATAEQALLGWTYRPTVQFERVDVELPRFQVAAAHRLSDALMALGLHAAFDGDRADFTGITTKEPLVIENVVHQTWIQVDEEGAEAAAATATVLKAGSAMPQGEPKLFHADRPFAFGLRDRQTGLLLFVGRVSDPRSKQS